MSNINKNIKKGKRVKTGIKSGILLAAGLAFLQGGQAVLAKEASISRILMDAGNAAAIAFTKNTGNNVRSYEITDTAETEGNIKITFVSDPLTGETYDVEYAPSDKSRFEIPGKEGYDFKGWCTTEDGTGTYYKNIHGISEDITLYGIWEEKPEGSLKKEKKLYIGEKSQLILQNGDGDLIWESNKPEVAKVNKEGIVTGLKKGNAVITVTQYGKQYQCKVTVEVPDAKKAYGILLAQMEDHKNMSYLLNNMDGRGEDELVLIDQLPVSIEDKETTGTASFVDTTKKKVKKTVRIYRYNKGEVILMKKLTFDNIININKHKNSGRLMIMNLHDNRADYHFLSAKDGKVHVNTQASYKGGEYPITSVTRATDKMIKSDFKYAVPKKKSV